MKALSNEELLVLAGTDPREVSGSDLASFLPRLSGSDLARCLPRLSDSDLASFLPRLSDSDLARCLPRLSGSDLARCLPRLSGSDLARCLPRLSGSVKKEAEKLLASVPVIEKPYTAILAAIKDGGKLEMGMWHSCKTTHCIGGWTVFLAGEKGKSLEDKAGMPNAPAMILRKSRPDAPLPNFYASNDCAMAFIKARAAEEK